MMPTDSGQSQNGRSGFKSIFGLTTFHQRRLDQPAASAKSKRNIWVAAGLFGVFVCGSAMLPSIGWISAMGTLLSFTAVILMQGNRWRSGALLLAALALVICGLEMLAGWLTPEAHGAGLLVTMDPREWTVPDPELGYRPRPNTKIVSTSSFAGEMIRRVTYTTNSDSTRTTPLAPAGADTYLFMGDSFVFGQGLADEDTLASQFAKANDFKVQTVNFSAPGYAPNHLVRALETGKFDRLQGNRTKAVITWIIPAHLGRVAGDGPWLGSSPCYVLQEGALQYAGSFERYRWSHPFKGLRHLIDQQFAFAHALGWEARQASQAEVFIALILRLRALVKEKFGTELVVVYSWPDEGAGPSDDPKANQDMIVSTLAGLRMHGISLISVDSLVVGYDVSQLLIPHDGHPTALTNQLIAAELTRRLGGP